ncbi:MAG: hypothetical protein JXR96_08185 [Deltaproteobacteria bacterium]|nr:hypothetical protein [Deltaproteobacteria bacterium]
MKLRDILMLAALVSALLPSAAQATDPQLARGIAEYEDFEYEAALASLQKAAAAEGLDDAERAKVHLYLGLVRYSLGDQEAARQDFERAIRLDYAIFPPPDTSPKIVKDFNAVKAGIPPPGPIAKPEPKPKPKPEPGLKPEPGTLRAEAPRGRLWTWIAAGVGAAAMIGAGTCGFLASEAKKDFDAAEWADDANALKSKVETRALAANVLYGVGGAALAAAVVLFFVEGGSSAPADDAGGDLQIVPAPGGLGAVYRF